MYCALILHPLFVSHLGANREILDSPLQIPRSLAQSNTIHDLHFYLFILLKLENKTQTLLQ